MAIDRSTDSYEICQSVIWSTRDVRSKMELSPLQLDGIKKLTDETGMFQHTKFSTIDRKEGYTTDDNARALISSLIRIRDGIGGASFWGIG